MSTIRTVLGGHPVVIHHGHGAPGVPTGLLGLDVETTYLGDQGQWSEEFHVRTVQVATTDEAWVFDLADERQRLSVVGLLSSPDVTFCSHTPMDVVSVWREFGVDISDRNVDTHQLAQMAFTDKRENRDLKALATRYGMPELEQAEAMLDLSFRAAWVEQGGKRNAKKADVHAYGWGSIDVSNEVFVTYAGLDAIACRRLVPELVKATRAPRELLAVEAWTSVRANRLELTGKRLDVERLEALHAEARTKHDKHKQAAEAVAGVNVNGPKIIDWLAEHGVDWDKWEGARTPGGKPSLAKENINLLTGFELDDEARAVVEHMAFQRQWMDLLRKTDDMQDRRVGDRIHPRLNPTGATTTARMSASGPNMQNFSKRDPRLRGLFLPEPGYVLATIDFAQIELRVVAALARDEVMIETIKAGGDLHQLTVDLLAERDVEITRDTGKMANFLIVYGGGPKALAEQANIPVEVAAPVVFGMREAYPGIDALSKYLAMEKEAVRTISGRRLPVTRDEFGKVRSYANINYAVQSAARELLVDAWRRLEIGHNRPGIVWWPIHDELVLMIPEGEVDAVLADAEVAMRFDFRGVPITADAVVLRDEDGTSRWMTSKLAEKIAKEAAA